MRLLTFTRTIAAPVDAVFSALAAVDRLPEWASSVESVELLDPPPIGVGTRYRETRRHNNRSATVEMTITELDPNERIEFTSDQGGLIISRWTLAPTDGGTATHLEIEIFPERWLHRLIVRIFAAFMRGVMRRCVDDDLDDLLRHLDVDPDIEQA